MMIGVTFSEDNEPRSEMHDIKDHATLDIFAHNSLIKKIIAIICQFRVTSFYANQVKLRKNVMYPELIFVAKKTCGS